MVSLLKFNKNSGIFIGVVLRIFHHSKLSSEYSPAVISCFQECFIEEF